MCSLNHSQTKRPHPPSQVANAFQVLLRTTSYTATLAHHTHTRTLTRSHTDTRSLSLYTLESPRAPKSKRAKSTQRPQALTTTHAHRANSMDAHGIESHAPRPRHMRCAPSRATMRRAIRALRHGEGHVSRWELGSGMSSLHMWGVEKRPCKHAENEDGSGRHTRSPLAHRSRIHRASSAATHRRCSRECTRSSRSFICSCCPASMRAVSAFCTRSRRRWTMA